MRCELHCHTAYSHDGFTSIPDLILECRRKDIAAVAITDHDGIGLTAEDYGLFAAASIELIPGCEITARSGVHIIGLFIRQIPPAPRQPVEEIVDYIRRQSGVVYVPHPFKAETGLLAVHPPDSPTADYALRSASCIELYNGGWDSLPYATIIRRLAGQYELTLVAGSDSHKPWQVGRFLNVFNDDGGLAPIVFERNSISLLGAAAGARIRSRHPGSVWRMLMKIRASRGYQSFIRRVPCALKRSLRDLKYAAELRSYQRALSPDAPVYSPLI